MSSFIVEQNTINRIITALDLDLYCDIKIELTEMGLGDCPNKLGVAMMELNEIAYDHRYSDDPNPFVVPYCSFDFCPQHVSRIQSLKSLRCWLYQCAEGNVPQQKLYQVMESFGHLLAQEIVSALPAYQNAEWG